MALTLTSPTVENRMIACGVFGTGTDAGQQVVVSAHITKSDAQPANIQRAVDANGALTSFSFPDTPHTGKVQRVTVSVRRADGNGRTVSRWSNLAL